MNSESRVVPNPSQSELRWLPAVPRPPRPGVHSCQCMCPTCESAGAGFFAQLAALEGQPDAAEHLTEAVYSFLQAQARSDHSQSEKNPEKTDI